MISAWRLYAEGRDILYGLASERPAAGRNADIYYSLDTGGWSVYDEENATWREFHFPGGAT